MYFKPVKNPNRPGRLPKGMVWAKDEQGNFIRNDSGEFGYREATPEELASKPARGKSARRVKAKKVVDSVRQTAVKVDEKLKAILLNKKTYKQLAASELQKIQSIVSGLMNSAKEAEKKALEKAIAALQKQREKLG